MGRTKRKQMEGGDLPTPEDHGLLRPAKDSVDKLDIILQEIKDSRQAIENRLSSITIELNILKNDQANLSERIKHTESDITEILPTHNTYKTTIAKLQQQVEVLQERVEDAEGRSRHNNIRILGLPEGTEGRDPTHYVETWLQSLATDRLSVHFTVERAHRVPGRKPAPGSPARTLIARILNYRDRDAILQMASEMDPRAEGIPYALLFPTKLRLTHNQQSLFF
ncbi:hypothetical protein NDU88_001169 [Pleurodeles waltl]|uniref:L1 transposable element RRM domain-containing protein n=1 Tax=Pleurodeles waltl TaxID=8319 RepID=A0AAV7SYK3_PLEWA|nr:hypothetical protein NDU88_001169 [Pleurodeles waltl]